MLICEDLLLLLTRDDGRTEAWVTYRDYALAAGLLADLALADCVEFEDRAKNPQVRLAGEGAEAGGAPSGAGSDAGPGAGSDAGVGQEGGHGQEDGPGAVMAFGIRALAERSKPPRVQSLVTAGWFNPKEVVSRSLVAQGVVELEEARFLGLRPERYPAVDEGPEAHTRARLQDALAGRGDIAVPDAMVLGILRGMDSAKVILKEEAAAEGLKGGALNKRIEQITEDLPAIARHSGRAVKASIDGINAAITGAIAASAAATAATT
ncbi:MAG TPA: GPP34 family phosphoprotein [Brevibacterium sp.]|nr:GPP34 family phosphoprotein [Brevibacterium sp.]